MDNYIYIASIFLPLISFLILGSFCRSMNRSFACFISSTLMVMTGACAIYVFQRTALEGLIVEVPLLKWMDVGMFKLNWALHFDTLTAVMVAVVNIVSAVVHVYSVGYMHEDESQNRFMAYLGLFTFAMLMLVTANNFVQLFFGWEGVGLASYLLIGFWYQKESANKAAIKAFVVNRVGDFGFALGILTVFTLTRSVEFSTVFANMPTLVGLKLHFLGVEMDAITLACLLLFMGAMGKSAQFGLHVWLPDAMEGPTPVSALIHAATMVTAGVFMLARLSPIFEYSQFALDVVTVVGAGTAFFAATVALTQNDIKRVIAYSTCSQLGYMFFAIGVSAYGAGVFHLFTHAFFKALLFLGAGSVIHGLHHEQDLRRMGGLAKMMPVTYVFMLIGSLALIGIPPFAGFYSKDMILESAWAAHSTVGGIAYVLGLLTAFMTSFYSTRLLVMAFHGKPRMDAKDYKHVHESPLIMILPMSLLFVGAVASGYFGYDLFIGEESSKFWAASLFTLPNHAETLAHAHHIPEHLKILPIVLGGAGIVLGFICYLFLPRIPAWTAKTFAPLYKFSFNKWYIDELYEFLFIRPGYRLAKFLWRGIDVNVIDRLGPNGSAWLMRGFAKILGRGQTGYVYHYAFVMIAALAGLLGWILWQRGIF